MATYGANGCGLESKLSSTPDCRIIALTMYEIQIMFVRIAKKIPANTTTKTAVTAMRRIDASTHRCHFGNCLLHELSVPVNIISKSPMKTDKIGLSFHIPNRIGNLIHDNFRILDPIRKSNRAPEYANNFMTAVSALVLCCAESWPAVRRLANSQRSFQIM